MLVEGAVFARYAPNGYLLYGRDGGRLCRGRSTPRTLKVSGTAVPVLQNVEWLAPDGLVGFDVAANGTLVYIRHSEWSVSRQVTWVDRAGTRETAIPDSGAWAEPRLSPDGRWIAVSQTVPKRDIWLFDRSRGVLSQLTHAPAAAFSALWTPDSRSVIYTYEDPVYDLHRIAIDGSAQDTTVLVSPYDKRATSMAPDGRTLVYSEAIDRTLLALLDVASGSSTRVDDRQSTQRAGMISPDGRWLLYDEASSDEQPQVFVRPLRGGGRVQVSPDGGDQPRWTRGGREIVYRRGDAMMTGSFDPATGNAGTPSRLFVAAGSGQLDKQSYGYDVTPDGSRFLLVTPIPRPDVQPTHVIVNWTHRLQEKMQP